jgi:probable rRNA maturation factor
MPISICNDQPIPVNASLLRRAATAILNSEGEGLADVSVLLTDDRTIHALNLKYRGQDKPTDVLSFALRDESEAGPTSNSCFPSVGTDRVEELGDVVISVETARRQAEQFGVRLENEVALLAVHGILHLLGYDDMTDEGAEEMTAKETAALASVGIARR